MPSLIQVSLFPAARRLCTEVKHIPRYAPNETGYMWFIQEDLN